MKWRQVLKSDLTQHKYAINSKLLGDDSIFAWSNLGYWTTDQLSYPQACQQLADRLAQAVNLNSNDRLLDLGCGKGASLKRWFEHYHVDHIEGVELQPSCVASISEQLPFMRAIHQNSFLNLKHMSFSALFDVVLCIDAAYHSDLNSFLSAVGSVLNSNGRLGFHYLILNRKFFALNSIQKLKYRTLLKCADVQLAHVMTAEDLSIHLNRQHFTQVKIDRISSEVLDGFAHFVERLKHERAEQQGRRDTLNWPALDDFKIEMTAKLCAKLAQEGMIDYVQVTAIKK